MNTTTPKSPFWSLSFPPTRPWQGGGGINWISKTNDEIIDDTMGEIFHIFPIKISNNEWWTCTRDQIPQGQARTIKYAVVKVPHFVYAAIPGWNKYMPVNTMPIPKVTMEEDWNSQKFLRPMEGAVLGGGGAGLQGRFQQGLGKS